MEIDWKTLFTSPAGRIKRQTYWIGWACQVAVVILNFFAVRPINTYASMAVSCLLLYPLYCIYAKRLQDMGKPGAIAAIPAGLTLVNAALGLYLILVMGIKPGANPFQVDQSAAATVSENLGTIMAISGVSLVISLIGFVFWLVLGIAGSQEGPNRFGPEPGADDDVFE